MFLMAGWSVEEYIGAIIAAMVLGVCFAMFLYAVLGPLLREWWKRLGVSLMSSLAAAILIFAYGIDLHRHSIIEGRFWVMVMACVAANEFVWQLSKCRCPNRGAMDDE